MASGRKWWRRPSRSSPRSNAASVRVSISNAHAIGGEALDRFGVPVRAEDIEATRHAGAALLGAVGGPKWDAVEPSLRPERGLLQIRKELELFANLRPVSVLPALAASSPLKPEIIADVDLLVVRELTGGIYFGEPSRRWTDERGRAAVDTLIYREHEIERVVRLAFELGQFPARTSDQRRQVERTAVVPALARDRERGER